MPRARRHNTDAPSHDSFLDIVANMVGILIILVMVVGVRVKNAPLLAAISGAAPEDREFQKDREIERSLRGDVLGMAEEIAELQQEKFVRRRERDALATMALVLEKDLESRRRQMDDATRRQFDLARQLSRSQLQLEQLNRQRVQIETAPADSIVIESYPTPLSQTVHGRESHFQLRGGRIVPVPVDELVARLKQAIERQKYKLMDLPELTGTVGPLGGFRLRYELVRREISSDLGGRIGVYAQFKRWTLIPVSSQMGETVDDALAEGSEFRRALASLDPERSTVTIWTYPDSFGSFRRLKQELFRLGFATAARPLPHGVPIGGSPQGSKSAAQ